MADIKIEPYSEPLEKVGAKSASIRGINFDSDTIKNAVIEYVNGNLSFDTIGLKHGMTGGNLRHWVIKLGYTPRKIHETRFNEQRITECCNLYKNGSKTNELAVKYKVDRRTIMDWLVRENIKPKKFNETLGITPELKEKARNLYINEKLNCGEISRIIGVSARSISDWVKDVKRSMSEIAIIKIAKNGSINSVWGKHGNIETKFGKIYYDSGYERDRINQLTKDESVVLLKRCSDRIKYQNKEGIIRNYLPDLHIEYKDGRIIVEEIKPYNFIKKFDNLIKFKCAKEFYKTQNIIFKVTTETKIYGKRFARI